MPPLDRIQLCLQRPFRAKLFSYRPSITVNGGKPKVDLTDDAIPSRFSYGPQTKKPWLSSERRLERERHQEVSALLFAVIYFDFTLYTCLI